MRTPDMFIKGLAAYLPERVPVEWAVERGLYPAEDVERLQLTGTVVAGDTPAPEMALFAAQDAVKRCGQRPEDLDLLLYADTWHQGPEGWLPCSYLQRHLTGGDVPAIEIRQGCSGMFGAMELAASYLRSDPERSAALLVTADNFGTPLMDRWQGGPFILGDAATAVVLSKQPGFARLLSVCSTTVPDDEELHRAGEPLFPPGITLGRPVSFKIRREVMDSRPEARAAAGARMMKLHQRFSEVVDQTLDEAGISVADITRMAIVNATREIVEHRGMGMMGVDIGKSTWDYGRTVGHCGASDQIMSLDHLLTAGELRPGDHFLMLATGPGIVLSCAVLEIVETPPWTA